MQNNEPVFQESDRFIKDFLKHAKKAKKRIWVQTMFFDPGAVTTELEYMISEAILHKVEVRFTIDWITKYYYENSLRFLPTWQKKWKHWKSIEIEREKLISRLGALGVFVTIVHKPGPIKGLVPIGGRNHNKIYIVDNIAWIGGVNIASEVGSRDVMIKFSDKKALEFLGQCFLSADNVSSDKTINIRNDYTFLYDAGRPFQSIILKEVISLIQHAKKKIIFVSQFIPEMSVLSALKKKSSDGVRTIILTGDKKGDIYTKFPLSIFYLLYKLQTGFDHEMARYHYRGKVHAKLLLVDDSIAMIGSHNFTWSTVCLGTTEIAMKTSNKAVISESRKFISDLLKKSEKAP